MTWCLHTATLSHLLIRHLKFSLKLHGAGHGSRAVSGIHCFLSLGSRDRGFGSHSGHGCLVFVYMCAFFCVCVHVEALRRADHPPKESYRLSKICKTEVKRRVLWKQAKAQIGTIAPKKKTIRDSFRHGDWS
jgi:hypothetical protein